jgi:hypothetical protein
LDYLAFWELINETLRELILSRAFCFIKSFEGGGIVSDWLAGKGAFLTSLFFSDFGTF